MQLPSPGLRAVSAAITHLSCEAVETPPKRKGLSLHGQVSLPLKQGWWFRPKWPIICWLHYTNHWSLSLVWKLRGGSCVLNCNHHRCCGSVLQSEGRMTANGFLGLWGSRYYSQSPHSKVLPAFPFVLPFIKLSQSLFLFLFFYYPMFYFNNFFKIEIFLPVLPHPPNTLSLSSLMFLQASLKVRGQEKCPVCSTFLCSLCFQLKALLPGGGFGMQKWVRQGLMLQESSTFVWEITKSYT